MKTTVMGSRIHSFIPSLLKVRLRGSTLCANKVVLPSAAHVVRCARSASIPSAPCIPLRSSVAFTVAKSIPVTSFLAVAALSCRHREQDILPLLLLIAVEARARPYRKTPQVAKHFSQEPLERAALLFCSRRRSAASSRGWPQIDFSSFCESGERKDAARRAWNSRAYVAKLL